MNENVDEEIGALLEGRLDSRRRTELLTRLATDDADYEVFTDTAAVLREAEEDESAEKESAGDQEVVREAEMIPLATDDADPEVLPDPGVESPEATGAESVVRESPGGREAVRETKVLELRPRRAMSWRSPAVRTLAAAAVLVAVAIPVLRSRMNGGSWRNPEHLYALSSAPGAGIPAEWAPAWGVKRGGGTTADETGLAARVGVLHMDMVVSANAGDSAQVSDRAREVAAALESADGSGPNFAAPGYHDIAKLARWTRADALRRLKSAQTEVVRYVDPDYFALGAWSEAARLAANRGDAAFFVSRESSKALEQAASLPGLDDDTKAAANHLRAVQRQTTIGNWDAVRSDLDALQRGLAH